MAKRPQRRRRPKFKELSTNEVVRYYMDGAMPMTSKAAKDLVSSVRKAKSDGKVSFKEGANIAKNFGKMYLAEGADVMTTPTYIGGIANLATRGKYKKGMDSLQNKIKTGLRTVADRIEEKITGD